MKDAILRKIEQHEIAIRPRLYFTVRLLALGAITAVALVASVLILNFILFSVRVNEHDALLGFGPAGIVAFAKFFPWSLLALDIACIALLEYLLRSFKFGYRAPVLYAFLLLVVGAFSIGFVIDRATTFNDDLFERALENRLPPPFNSVYQAARHAAPPGSFFCRCTIVAIAGDRLTVSDTRAASTTYTVIVPKDEQYATTTALRAGDVVILAGDLDGDEIRVFGARPESRSP